MSERLYRWPDVEQRVGWTKVHTWREEQADRFPKRIHLGPNSVAWVADEIDLWLTQRIAARELAPFQRAIAAAAVAAQQNRDDQQQDQPEQPPILPMPAHRRRGRPPKRAQEAAETPAAA